MTKSAYCQMTDTSTLRQATTALFSRTDCSARSETKNWPFQVLTNRHTQTTGGWSLSEPTLKIRWMLCKHNDDDCLQQKSYYPNLARLRLEKGVTSWRQKVRESRIDKRLIRLNLPNNSQRNTWPSAAMWRDLSGNYPYQGTKKHLLKPFK